MTYGVDEHSNGATFLPSAVTRELVAPTRTNNTLEIHLFMKRLALLAAVVLFAACAPKAEETPAETAAPTATMDSAATMTDSTKMDSTVTDSTATKAM